MTIQEHALMIGLLTVQLEAISAIADALKSRDVLDDGDLHAFYAIRPVEARKETTERAHQIYRQIAEAVGLDTVAAGLRPIQ